MLVYKYRGHLFGNVGELRNNSRIFALYLVLFLISFFIVCYFPVEYGDNTWYNKLSITCCVISIIYMMGQIDWDSYKLTSPLVKLSTYSFGIYIWHGVGPFLISNTAKRLFGLEYLAENHVFLFPLCFSLITLAISIFLSWIMMKTRIGRFLIG